MKTTAWGAILVAVAAQADAQTSISLRITTGADGLRSGSSAFLSFVLSDATRTSEQWIGTGFGGWSQVLSNVNFPERFAPGGIRAIIIRHDGSPRSGYPFEEYDNWDLRFLNVRITNGPTIYESNLDSARFEFIHHFNAESRTRRIILQPLSSHVDVVVPSIRRVPRGMTVRIANRGAAGVVRTVWCRSPAVASRSAFRPVSISLARGATSEATVSWAHVPGERVACYADGVDALGVAELITANNGTMAP